MSFTIALPGGERIDVPTTCRSASGHVVGGGDRWAIEPDHDEAGVGVFVLTSAPDGLLARLEFSAGLRRQFALDAQLALQTADGRYDVMLVLYAEGTPIPAMRREQGQGFGLELAPGPVLWVSVSASAEAP